MITLQCILTEATTTLRYPITQHLNWIQGRFSSGSRKETGTILDYRALFSKDSEGFDNGGHLTIYTDPEDKISVRLQSGSDSYMVHSSEAISLNEWYLLTFTFGTEGNAALR